MSTKNAKLLIEKYLNGDCTPEEKSIVENWYNQFSKEAEMPSGDIDFQALEQEIYTHLPRNKNQFRWKYAVAAAIALFVLSIGVFFYLQTLEKDNSQLVAQEMEIVPGGNKATLTLADGKTIELNSDMTGIVVSNDGLMYNDSTLVSLDMQKDQKESTEWYTVTTPKGGQYQVVLSDGTKVWLNSASSLKYPVKFRDPKVRQVELTGEGYFEVAKSDKVPFIVKTKEQEVKVLGTHFNLNAYDDENATRTSLLEGSVLVSMGAEKSGENTEKGEQVILKPNQQSVLSLGSEKFKVTEFDAASVIAWKEGLFSFNNSDIQSVMRQLGRWYNVDISFEGSIPENTFSGKIYRDEQITKVYELLDYYSIKYEVKGHHIKIYGSKLDSKI